MMSMYQRCLRWSSEDYSSARWQSRSTGPTASAACLVAFSLPSIHPLHFCAIFNFLPSLHSFVHPAASSLLCTIIAAAWVLKHPVSSIFLPTILTLASDSPITQQSTAWLNHSFLLIVAITCNYHDPSCAAPSTRAAMLYRSFQSSGPVSIPLL